MSRQLIICFLGLFSFLFVFSPAQSQEVEFLRVDRATLHADGDNAELCMEFNRPLAQGDAERIRRKLHIETDGIDEELDNISVIGASLCMFPMDRGKTYRVVIDGDRGNGKSSSGIVRYSSSFDIPNKLPSLAFLEQEVIGDGFLSYNGKVNLRSINVDKFRLEAFLISDKSVIGQVWQNRKASALAPSESAYLAKEKGSLVWSSDRAVQYKPNEVSNIDITIRDLLPDLRPGLYLLLADAREYAEENKNKGLSPAAAVWFIKSDFNLYAVRDYENTHVFAFTNDGLKPKPKVVLNSCNKEATSSVETDANGHAVIKNHEGMSCVVAADAGGNISVADIEDVSVKAAGSSEIIVGLDKRVVAPGEEIKLDVVAPEDIEISGVLKLKNEAGGFFDLSLPVVKNGRQTMAFAAPAFQGKWEILLENPSGAISARTSFIVTSNPYMPKLQAISGKEFLSADDKWHVVVTSITSKGEPSPFVNGRALVAWRKMDAKEIGWKGYSFGLVDQVLAPPVFVGSFLTDDKGEAHEQFLMPKPPQDRGLYKAEMQIEAEHDSGILRAPSVFLPLRSDGIYIGIKPMVENARFAHNGNARFSVISISSDGKPKDMAGLSYQVYEEGRSFSWYQDNGRWQYKPEPHLRPVGGGGLNIRGDASTVIEVPVTSGNYRIEIMNRNGKPLTQMRFSAGWNSGKSNSIGGISVSVSHNPRRGQPVDVGFSLAEDGFVSFIAHDKKIRKSVGEFMKKGSHTVSFVPDADWGDKIIVNIAAFYSQKEGGVSGLVMGESKVTLATDRSSEKKLPTFSGAVVYEYDPERILLKRGGPATLSFGILNKNNSRETFKYSFSGTGLKISGPVSGEFSLEGGSVYPLSVDVVGEQSGVADLRMSLVDSSSLRFAKQWKIEVASEKGRLASGAVINIENGKTVVLGDRKKREGDVLMVSSRPLAGFVEIWGELINSEPFTTSELAMGADALRRWAPVVGQIGVSSEARVDAIRKEWMLRMLRHQNDDGGFARYRGGASTIRDTAAALSTLASDKLYKNGREAASASHWIKQRLANTWLEEKERSPRAAAFAAMAQIGALDASSLRYFSDISLRQPLNPVADAHMVAAFRKLGDEDLSSAWLKKMRDEDGGDRPTYLLDALVGTDVFSSDKVDRILEEISGNIKGEHPPSIKELAAVLRVLHFDLYRQPKLKFSVGKDEKEIDGIFIIRPKLAEAFRNLGDRSLVVTALGYKDVSSAKSKAMDSARRIYRLNGVEMPSAAKPVRNETYMIELKGKASGLEESDNILVQFHDQRVRVAGCPLSNSVDTLSVVPWFTAKGLSKISSCESDARGVSMVLDRGGKGDVDVYAVLLAKIDAEKISDISSPKIRVLKQPVD